jgi:hypothetical protein
MFYKRESTFGNLMNSLSHEIGPENFSTYTTNHKPDFSLTVTTEEGGVQVVQWRNCSLIKANVVISEKVRTIIVRSTKEVVILHIIYYAKICKFDFWSTVFRYMLHIDHGECAALRQ